MALKLLDMEDATVPSTKVRPAKQQLFVAEVIAALADRVAAL